MSFSVLFLFRAPVRPVLLLALTVLGMVVFIPSHPAYALEKQTFGDITVGPGGTNGDVSTVFGDVVVNGKVDGNVEANFGDVRVNAPVTGQVKSDFGDAYINSLVGENLEVGHGDVYLIGKGAKVVGDVSLGSGEIIREGNPRIGGTVSSRMPAMAGGRGDEGGWGVGGFVKWFFGTLVFVAIAVLAAVFAPRQISSSARRMEESFGRSLLVGIASVPAAVVLAVVLAVSLIGIPLLLLAAPAYLAFVFFGALVSSYFIGRRVLIATGRYHAGNALAAAVGASILSLPILIPFVGELILYGLALTGAGAAVMALFKRRRPSYPSYEPYAQERRG